LTLHTDIQQVMLTENGLEKSSQTKQLKIIIKFLIQVVTERLTLSILVDNDICIV